MSKQHESASLPLYASDGHHFHIVPVALEINNGLCGDRFVARKLGTKGFATYQPANNHCKKCLQMIADVKGHLYALNEEGAFA